MWRCKIDVAGQKLEAYDIRLLYMLKKPGETNTTKIRDCPECQNEIVVSPIKIIVR